MGAFEYASAPSTIAIIKALYDYLDNTLEIEATSAVDGEPSPLYVEGVGDSNWIRAGKWSATFTGVTMPPAAVTVCGALESCQTDP